MSTPPLPESRVPARVELLERRVDDILQQLSTFQERFAAVELPLHRIQAQHDDLSAAVGEVSGLVQQWGEWWSASEATRDTQETTHLEKTFEDLLGSEIGDDPRPSSQGHRTGNFRMNQGDTPPHSARGTDPMYDQDWNGWRLPPTMADLRSGEMPRDARPAPAGHAGEMPLPQGTVNQQAGVQALGDLDGLSRWAAPPPTNSGWELAQRPEAGTSGSHIPAQGDARARLDWQLAQYHVPPEMLGTSVMQSRPGTGEQMPPTPSV